MTATAISWTRRCGPASRSARTASPAPTWARMRPTTTAPAARISSSATFVNEMLGLYHNENGTLFRDVAPRSEVGRASLLAVTWATFFFDADLDGFPRHLCGERRHRRIPGADARARLSQAPLLLRNRGNGTFENITSSLGAAFNRPVMGRGAAYLDFDGDGDLDLAMTTLDGPAVLFSNDGGSGHHWLRVRTTDEVEPERHRRHGTRDERVGNAVADGAQRLELRVAERVDAHLRTGRGHPGDAGRGDVAVGQNADTHGRPRPTRSCRFRSSRKAGQHVESEYIGAAMLERDVNEVLPPPSPVFAVPPRLIA